MTPKDVQARANALQDQGFNCAEAVLMAVAEATGTASGLVPKAATCFGGRLGPALEGRCGALSGGLIALGCATGRTGADQSLQGASALAMELRRQFECRFGSCLCPRQDSPMTGPSVLCVCGTVIGETAAMAFGLLEPVFASERPEREASAASDLLPTDRTHL